MDGWIYIYTKTDKIERVGGTFFSHNCSLCIIIHKACSSYCFWEFKRPIFSNGSCGPVFSKEQKAVLVLPWKTLSVRIASANSYFPLHPHHVSNFQTSSLSLSAEKLKTSLMWRLERWGEDRVKTDKHLPQQQEKWNHMAHFISAQIHGLLSCRGKHCSTLHPPPVRLLSFVSSEVRHIDWDPIKNHNQMRTLGRGERWRVGECR